MQLRKADFVSQQIEDYYFQKDKQARDLVMRVFNKTRKDFDDEEDFYTYQEEIEDKSTTTFTNLLVFALVNGINAQ